MIVQHPQLTIPREAQTLDGFRQWVLSDEYPSRGTVVFANQEIHIDMSPDRAESHNLVKTKIYSVLDRLVEERDLGRLYSDRLWLTNSKAELSTEPDGTFTSWERIENGCVTIVDGSDGIEMRGEPDWTLEVVSNTSVRKDTESLFVLYYRASVREYWLVDARGDDLQFTIYRRGHQAFEAVEPVTAASDEAWLWSEVFHAYFPLERSRDRAGGWKYALKVRQTNRSQE